MHAAGARNEQVPPRTLQSRARRLPPPDNRSLRGVGHSRMRACNPPLLQTSPAPRNASNPARSTRWPRRWCVPASRKTRLPGIRAVPPPAMRWRRSKPGACVPMASVARWTSVRRVRTGSWPSGRALRQHAICWRPWLWESSRWPWPALHRIDCSRQPLPTTRQRYAPSPSSAGVWRIRSGNGTASPCWNVRRQAAMPCRPHCWPSACCVAKACRPSPMPLHSSCSSCSPWA